ncbi:hypothetical protein ACJ72_01682 [Emergomyces africanus]|uniref:Initiation-specific alpha-1,6-mannosyltransferase n=1 Tax=Emergomyces africanus TaxID=1955775 RepID=A0A1B7P4J2_9EURO|nr:hypothetical protein ACJ72_01682 [Emergomyces africanus]
MYVVVGETLSRSRRMCLVKPLSSFKLRMLLAALITSSVCLVSYHNKAALTPIIAPFRQDPSRPPSSLSFPKKIWYKLGPKGLTPQTLEWADSCSTQNPNFTMEFLTDTSAEEYVKTHFSYRPDIVETYISLRVPILKADLLRYLLLLSEGGIWNDLDVSCEKIPIHDWVPEQFKHETNLVVGWEFDVGWGYEFRRQFTSWTVMAKPGCQHLQMVVDDIVRAVNSTKEKHNLTSISDLQLSMVGDVVDYTGPRRLTAGVLKSLSKQLGKKVDEKKVSTLLSPKLIADVLILPGYAFASSANNYTSVKWPNGTDFVPGPPLVTHHYLGSWKNAYGGEVV